MNNDATERNVSMMSLPSANSITCTLCGANKTRFLFRPPRSPGPVVQCRLCGLIYISPREDFHALIMDGPVQSGLPDWALTSDDPSVLIQCWERALIQAKEENRDALQRNASFALNRIEKYRSPPGRLLDHGCGAGFFLSAAVTRGWESYGLEPLVGHAIYARAYSGAQVITDTLHADTFTANFFDVVTSFQVFEHLPDPATELDKLWLILKRDGLLLIEVPNIETWSVKLLGKRHRHFVPDHLYFFSPRTLHDLVLKHSFEPLELYYPRRYMTLRHLILHWGKYLFGERVANLAKAVLCKLGIENKVVSISLGDIIAIVARKR